MGITPSPPPVLPADPEQRRKALVSPRRPLDLMAASDDPTPSFWTAAGGFLFGWLFGHQN